MHKFYMQKALELAQKGEGHTAPNPMVGCLFVKEGQIIAQGYHKAYGGLHAEREALNKANPQELKDATAYVTLEPCSHYGKQPPCVDALIEAGISHVVFPFCDRDKNVQGGGLKKLMAAGISVTLGVEVAPAFEQIADFMKHRSQNIPLVRAKWAMSLDGKIATHTGDSRWISGKESRKTAHELRHKSQAILIGARCLRKDNPQLNVRLDMPHPSQPTPIVMLGQNAVDCDAHIFRNPQTIAIAPQGYNHPLPPSVELIRVRANEQGYACPQATLKALGQRNIISLLIEGGGEILADFMGLDLIDEYHVFIAPKLIGGSKAPTAFDGQGFSLMAQAAHLQLIGQSLKETDMYLHYESQKFHQWKKEQIACLQAL